jgi:chromosome segregation ATPase
MTVLTALVLWSVAARLPTVFSDTKTIAQEVEALTERIHAKTLSPDEQRANEEALMGVLSKEDEAQRKRARVNEELGPIETEKEELERRQQELRNQQHAIEESLEEPRKRLRKIFDRDIIVHEGPPPTYDPGPQPRVRFYYPTRWLSEDWRAWRAAKEACDRANKLQKATGIDLEEVAEKIAAVKKQVDALKEKLAQAEAWIAKLDQERKRYTDAPGELLSDLDKLRKQLARTSFIRTVFWLLDIPTLLSCLATTAVAYSRMFLISGRFAPRQLARSRP